MNRYLVIFEHPEEGTDWGAYVPDLPGCVAVAKTREACEALIREAIDFHIEGLLLGGDKVPKPTVVGEMVDVPLAA